MTSQSRAGPVKMDEHKDIEKKVDIFHILNNILAKTRNLLYWSYRGFVGELGLSFISREKLRVT